MFNIEALWIIVDPIISARITIHFLRPGATCRNYILPALDLQPKSILISINMTSTDALSPDRIVDLAAKALGDSQPNLRTPAEAIALIGHACMAAVDFRLVGLGEDHNLRSFFFP